MQSINETNPALALAELLPNDRLDLAAFQAAADRLAKKLGPCSPELQRRQAEAVAKVRELAGPAGDIYSAAGFLVSRGTAPAEPIRNRGHILAEYSKAARALNGVSIPSKRITNTFALAVSDRVRVENKTFTDLLAMLKDAGQAVGEAGQERQGSPVEWLVTMHQTGKLGNTTTALSVDGKRVVRATHESGAIWILKGLARASGGRVVFVKPSERLGKGDLMRLRGVVFRGGRSCTIAVKGAGQGVEVDPVAEAKARQLAKAEREQLEHQRQASAFSCVLDALCNLPDVERKPLLKADGEQALRAWVDGQLAQLYDTADARYKYRLDAVQLYRLQITAPEVIAARKAAAKS